MPTQAPYGDIFLVNTPTLDRVSQQLYQEQKQRELYQQQQNKMLDDEFARNMSGIRDADIGDLTKAYGEFKLANQALIKNKTASPTEQLEVLRKKAAVYDIINNSKEHRQNFETPLQKDLLAHPDKYDDNAHNYLKESLQTPISKLNASSIYKDEKGNPVDLTNPLSYQYKGTDFNMQNAEKVAAGTIKNSYSKSEKIPLGEKITNYQFGNTPAQFKESYLGSLATNKGGRAAAAIWDNLDPNTIEEINKEYAAISPDKWEQMTGSRTPQNLEPKNPYNKAEQLASYQAKLYALNNEPRPVSPVVKYDKEQVMEKQDKLTRNRQLLLESVRFGHAKQLQAAGAVVRNMSPEGQQAEMNEIMGGITGAGAGNEVSISPLITKKWATAKDDAGHILYATKVVRNKDNNGVIYEYETVDGKPSVYSQNIPDDQLRKEIAHTYGMREGLSQEEINKIYGIKPNTGKKTKLNW